MMNKITKSDADAALAILWQYKKQLMEEIHVVEGLAGKVEGLQASIATNITVESLDISVRAYGVLKSYIYRHMGSQPESQSIRYIDEAELCDFPGAGRQVVKEIKKELARFGIPLRNPISN